MNDFLTSMLSLLVVATLVALIAHRLKLPYTVGLVLAGIALAVSPFQAGLTLTQSIIYEIILPPLLFEAAINIQWKDLRLDALPILTLALPGTLISAAFVTAALHFGLGWPMPPALMFGVLIAATDPVAVIAMFKDNGVRGRLRLLVESESLLNDGVAAVLFALALVWVQAAGQAHVSVGQIGGLLLVTVGGGILAGALCAGVAILLVCAAPRIIWWRAPSPPCWPIAPSCWPSIFTARACWPRSQPGCCWAISGWPRPKPASPAWSA